eukprot:m51a1_g7861 putative periplasmic ligand-binding sensor domain-containing protein (966) ;mRNA; f:257529-262278
MECGEEAITLGSVTSDVLLPEVLRKPAQCAHFSPQRRSAWSSLRLRVFGVALGAVLLLAAAIATSVVLLSASSVGRMERSLAVQDVAVAMRGFCRENLALDEMIRSWNTFSDLVQYIAEGVPEGPYFKSFVTAKNMRSFKLSDGMVATTTLTRAEAATLSGPMMQCSAFANDTDTSYYGVISVLRSIYDAAPVGYMLVQIGTDKAFGERVGSFRRNTELQSVAQMVDTLLDSLERQKESSRTPARQVASYLNDVFWLMDTVLDKYTAIKVCTIGDAYGIIAQVALEFRGLCRSKKMDEHQDLLFRIGIATGPCSASLVGSKKLKYEVWGEAVSESEATTVYPIESPEHPRTVLLPKSSSGEVTSTSRSSQIGDLGALYVSPKGSWASLLRAKSKKAKAGRQAQSSKSPLSVGKIVRSLRLRISFLLFLLSIVGVVVMLGMLLRVSNTANKSLLGQIGEGNVVRMASMLVATQSEMQSTTVSWATWDAGYDFVLNGDQPNTSFWVSNFGGTKFFRSYQMDAVMYILRNGTLRRGAAYGYFERKQRNLSDAEVRVVADYLVAHDTFVGVMNDPIDGVPRIVSASKVAHSDGSGDHIGWLVMTRDVRTLMGEWTYDAVLCAGMALRDTVLPPKVRELFRVKEGSSFVTTTKMVLRIPDSGTGGLGFLLLVVDDTDQMSTQEGALWDIAAISMALVVVAPVACLAVVELLFFRPMGSLRKAISQLSQGKRLTFRGIRELANVADSVNFLLESIESEEGHAAQSSLILSNMFPAHIYAALLRGDKTTELTDTFESASILFSQAVGFSAWAAVTPPRDVLRFLNGMVAQMDAVAETYGVVKIKTIQDIYMAISGIPQQTAESTAQLARVALRFRELARSNMMGGEPVRLQMGLSTGPCSGGIIGKSMWLYDIWSDTVNLAARLRAKAPPGCIMCCADTCQRLEGTFDFGQPLQLQLKGKGFQSLHPLLSEH